MKVIDLMQMYANKEVLPKKIIIHDYHVFDEDTVWEHKNNTFYCREYNGDIQFLFEYIVPEMLNDEVEIIEDTPKEPIVTLRGTSNSIRKTLDLPSKCDLPQYKDWWQQEQENKALKENKKIEKLDLEDLNKLLNGSSDFYMAKHIVHKALVETKSKINEMIDKINSGE